MRGMAIVVVLVMMAVTAIMGLGLHMYSLSTRFQVARASYSTAAEYLCEAACEEGFFMAQKAMNNPDYDNEDFKELYERVRNRDSGAFSVEYKPIRLLKRLAQKEYDGISAEFPADGVHAEMELEFGEPYSNLSNCVCEYGGTLTFRASVRPSWTSGNRAFRSMTVRRSFKVVLVTPPHPFGQTALTIIHPDYINGASKQKIQSEIFDVTNQGIDQHNQICKLYKQTYKTAKQVIPTKCDTCASLPYVNGSPPFLTPRIPDGAKIPPDFFHDDSVLMAQPGRDKFDKLIDFNYEDFLRERWPPLYAFFQTLLAISTMNGSLLVVTTAVLACIPPTTVNTVASIVGIGAVLEAIHKILQVIVPIQFGLGQVLLAAQKVVMEGLIVGQLFYQADQALQGNFKPSAEGAATFMGDLAASGVFDSVDQTEEGLQGMQDATDGQTVTGDAISTAEDGSISVDADKLSENVDAVRDNKFDGFEDQLNQMKDLEGMEGNINGLGDSLTNMFGGSSTKGVGPLSGVASDSDMSMLTGLIKGFIDSHRKFFTYEPIAGSGQHAIFRTAFGAFDGELFKQKATFYTTTQEQVTELFTRYEERGLCGIIYYSGSEPLEISTSSFKGKLIIYSTAPVNAAKVGLADDKLDSVTIITPLSITLGDRKVQASLNAVGQNDSFISFGKDPEIIGNILLAHYRVEDQRKRKSNDRALKGKLRLNKRLDQREKDGKTIKPSHLRVIVSPGILSQEVKMTK